MAVVAIVAIVAIVAVVAVVAVAIVAAVGGWLVVIANQAATTAVIKQKQHQQQ